MRVYVASTLADLAPHREAVREAIRSIEKREFEEFEYAGPEYSETTDEVPLEARLKEISESSVIILLLGWRYGYIAPSAEKSVLELEYDAATNRGLTVLPYIIDDDYPVPAKLVETGTNAERLRHFKERVRKEKVVKTFTTPENLARQVVIDLTYWYRRSLSQAAEDIIARPHLERELQRTKETLTVYEGTINSLRARLGSVVPAVPIWVRRNFKTDSTFCFALLPFQEGFFRVYEDGILPAVKAAGLRCAHAGEIFDNREIVEDVWESICTSRLVVADVTGRNPNVFYELGICHTLGKEVIVLTQNRDDVPFDIRHRRFLAYEPDKLMSLKGRLEKTIKNILVRTG